MGPIHHKPAIVGYLHHGSATMPPVVLWTMAQCYGYPLQAVYHLLQLGPHLHRNACQVRIVDGLH
jgi:hypothetical protein